MYLPVCLQIVQWFSNASAAMPQQQRLSSKASAATSQQQGLSSNGSAATAQQQRLSSNASAARPQQQGLSSNGSAATAQQQRLSSNGSAAINHSQVHQLYNECVEHSKQYCSCYSYNKLVCGQPHWKSTTKPTRATTSSQIELNRIIR